jgi:hypothetical protein
MDGIDDLRAVDPLQIHRRDPEVRVPELALDDIERHTLPCHLDRVRVAQLMRRKAPPNTRLGRREAQLPAHARRGESSAAGAAVDDA